MPEKNFLFHLEEIITEELKEFVGEPQAFDKSKVIAEKFRRLFSGETLYCPKRGFVDISKRNAEIIEKFNGKNQRFLSHHYDLSLKQIYKILDSHDKNQLDWCDSPVLRKG